MKKSVESSNIDPNTKRITAPITIEMNVPIDLSFLMKATIAATNPATPRDTVAKTGIGIIENLTWREIRITKEILRAKPHLPNREWGRKVIFIPAISFASSHREV